MAIKIKDLVKILKTKDQDAEVEFIVVENTGNIICMDLKTKARDMIKMLKLFKGKPV